MIWYRFCRAKLSLTGRNASGRFAEHSDFLPEIETFAIFAALTPVLFSRVKFDPLKSISLKGVSSMLRLIRKHNQIIVVWPSMHFDSVKRCMQNADRLIQI